MTVIAALTGASKATLYSYFSSKGELFVESVESSADQHKGMLQNICEGGSADIYHDVRLTIALLQPSEDIASTLKLLGERVLGTFFTPQKLAVRRMIISSSRNGEIGRLFYVPKALRNFRRLGLRTPFRSLSKILSLVLKSIFRLYAADTKGYRGVVKQNCQSASNIFQ
ncbi:MAG: TetR/AcrR family transcriptional regulator [Methylobacter sp.]|jgi:AcrR family transcriptional regulator|nr:TetR/AcrR family transcriptional regulator [Methylobacter sp.]